MQLTKTTAAYPFTLSHSVKILLWCSLGFALIARLVCNAIIPLTDTTEARYGEIARKMLETGDWITPQHDYGVPFWAKPPLSTWFSAFSMKLFGVNEFAVRLPSLLLGIGMLMLVWYWVKAQRNRDFALTVCAVLASMSLFFMASGAVMTDASLTFCTTLTMISFWRAINAETGSSASKIWGYLFFVALGVGILAKGLLVGVLTFFPIVPWVILRGKATGTRGHWRALWQALPWIRGSVLMLVISVPWYIIAERKTPGFLAYFILGEHFSRFMHSGWRGDKYGNAHAEAFGMIWAFLTAAALPWSLVLIAKFKPLWNVARSSATEENGWISYLLLWSFVPILFFTFAHNIIWTYPLPALPAFAVLVVELLQRSDKTHTVGARFAMGGFATPLVLLVFAGLYAEGHHSFLKSSQKDSAVYFVQHRPDANSGLYYLRHRYYSSEFYSDGKSKEINLYSISRLFDNGHTDFLVALKDDLDALPPALRSHFASEKQFGNYVMLRELNSESISTLNAAR